jgi:hypothetical protein
MRERYRFFTQTILMIVDLRRETKRSHALPPLLAVILSSEFLASNVHYIVIAQVHDYQEQA